MKNIKKRFIGAILLAAMVFSNLQVQTAFAMNDATVLADEMKSEVETSIENRLNYILVESPYLQAPDTQNIVVSWGDGTEKIQKMELTVQKEDGTIEKWRCSNRAEYLYVFSKRFSDEREQSTYRVINIRVEESGKEQSFRLADLKVEAEFGVNKSYSGMEALQPLNPEDTSKVEASVVSIDENGEMQAQDNIVTALHAVSEDTGYSAKVRSAERAGEIVVALDPGHDSSHGGTSGYGMTEQDLTLKIANYAKAELEEYDGIKVYMTRTTKSCPYLKTSADTADCIKQRVQAAAKAGAKIYVSFHLNHSPSTAANGAEVIIPNNSWKPQVATQGKELAEKILNELAAVGLNKRPTPIYSKDTTVNEKYPDGSKSDYFLVQIYAKEAGMPGITVEHAFLSNANDVNRFLKTEAGLKKLGIADATGIAKYLGLSKGKWVWDSSVWKWKYETAGHYVSETWKYIDGKWYYFDNKGYMQTGWKYIDGKWYYLNGSGVMQTGWIAEGGKWYYLNGSGVMQTGWIAEGGKWYYLNGSGVMQTGWIAEGGKWYYLNASGVMQTGWIAEGGKWYYLNGSGVMQTGWIADGGNRYYLNKSGVMQTGWQYIDGNKYHFNRSGMMETGWIAEGGKWYYLNKSGMMQTGWIADGGKWYYLNGSGVMQTGWITDGNEKYYLNASGEMQIGWQYISSKWYYFNRSGMMETSWLYKDERWYYLNENGVMQTGWQYISSKWYYFNRSGMMETGWLYVGGKWYYLDSSGAMQKGWLTLGSKKYYFNSSGVMLTGNQVIDGKMYQFATSGELLLIKNGWQYVNGKWYYFDKMGQMQTGWLTLETGKYYLTPEGVMVKGWYYINTKWYYFNEHGVFIENKSLPSDLYAISGNTSVTLKQMCDYFISTKKKYPADALQKGGAATLEEFCKIIIEEANAEGIRAEVVFAQAMLETGWLQFGGDVKIEQFNFAGLGATGNGAAGEFFASVRIGIRAQVQHLKAYGNSENLKNSCVDNRFKYVKRNSAPFVEWLGQKENPAGLGWATSGAYGSKILEIINKIKKM